MASAMPLRLATGRTVAFVVGAILVVPVTSKNYFAEARGFSLDAAVLAQAIRLGAIQIEWAHKDGRRWRLSIDAFRAQAQRIDFGHGIKLACSEDFYHECGNVQRKPAPITGRAAPETKAPRMPATKEGAEIVQPGLLGRASEAPGFAMGA